MVSGPGSLVLVLVTGPRLPKAGSWLRYPKPDLMPGRCTMAVGSGLPGWLGALGSGLGWLGLALGFGFGLDLA